MVFYKKIILIFSLVYSWNVMAIEEPQYDLINKTHSYEIRMYKEISVQTIK